VPEGILVVLTQPRRICSEDFQKNQDPNELFRKRLMDKGDETGGGDTEVKT
jgi:hypothetical protein